MDDPADREMVQIERLLAGGVEVAFLDEPYVHAKTILADGKTAFVGSQNFSRTSLDFNRELGIVFDDAAAVNRLASAFLQDWNVAEKLAADQPASPQLPPGDAIHGRTRRSTSASRSPSRAISWIRTIPGRWSS